jgi:carbonic anhydrase/acetyltransferase-like protein (isoleucine patch superfamily)
MPEFELDGRRPRVHPDAYVAPTAVLIGNVELGAGASVWFGAILRGDESTITIGRGSNVQDGTVIHCSADLPTVVGENVTIGHRACLEGCVVEDGALVGTGSIMLQRSRLGKGAMLAAGSLLGEGREVPAGHSYGMGERGSAVEAELEVVPFKGCDPRASEALLQGTTTMEGMREDRSQRLHPGGTSGGRLPCS